MKTKNNKAHYVEDDLIAETDILNLKRNRYCSCGRLIDIKGRPNKSGLCYSCAVRKRQKEREKKQ